MSRSVAQKMGLRASVSGASESDVSNMGLSGMGFSTELDGEFDHIHLFVKTRAEMDEEFPEMKAYLAKSGSLWVSWPKSGQLGTDLTPAGVIRIGYAHGLVESKTISVDGTWSAIKFTRPVAGKVYRNSYGTLPGQPDDVR